MPPKLRYIGIEKGTTANPCTISEAANLARIMPWQNVVEVNVTGGGTTDVVFTSPTQPGQIRWVHFAQVDLLLPAAGTAELVEVLLVSAQNVVIELERQMLTAPAAIADTIKTNLVVVRDFAVPPGWRLCLRSVLTATAGAVAWSDIYVED